VGGNIEGGNPVEVTPMKEASLFSRGRDDQSGASGPTSVTPPIPWSEPSALYRHLLTTLTLVTHHLALHKPL